MPPQNLRKGNTEGDRKRKTPDQNLGSPQLVVVAKNLAEEAVVYNTNFIQYSTLMSQKISERDILRE